MSLRLAFLFSLSLFCSACGFHLRGAVDIPYTRFYIASPSADSALGTELRRQIQGHRPEVLVDSLASAEAVFHQIGNSRERVITVLNADGRVREYQLRLVYSFRIDDREGNALSPVANIIIAREMTYDDNLILAKEQEEEFLWQEMERDLVQQILRRLATLPPRPKTGDGENAPAESPSESSTESPTESPTKPPANAQREAA